MRPAAWLGCLVLISASPAAAASNGSPVEDIKMACADASEEAQVARDQGRFLDARAGFLSCVRKECPDLIRRDCEKWVSEMNDRTPSVVFIARDARGGDLPETRVFVDGKLVSERLDGRAVHLDPGEHKLRWEKSGVTLSEQTVILSEGERGRVIRAELPSTPKAPALRDRASDTPNPSPETKATAVATSKRARVPVMTYVLGGVGIGALGASAVFALLGKQERDNLRDTCAPDCALQDIDEVRAKLRVADWSLGLGVAAIGAAAVWFALSSPEPSKSSLALRLGTTSLGPRATLEGSF